MPMTPEEFAERMQAIKDKPEHFDEYHHAPADALLVECLESLGYGEGCELYESIDKWFE